MTIPIGLYLKTNIDNFVAIQSADWYSNHSYPFYPAGKSPDKFAEQSKRMAKQIDDLIKNKDKYKSEWYQERLAFEKQIGTVVEEINKRH